MSTDNNNPELENQSQVGERDTRVGVSKGNRNLMIVAAALVSAGLLFYVVSTEGEKITSKKEEFSQTVDTQRKESVSVVRDYEPTLELPPQMPDIPDLVAPPAPPNIPQPVRGVNSLLPQVNPNGGFFPSTQQIPPAVDVGSAAVQVQLDESYSITKQDRGTPMLVISGNGRASQDPANDHGISNIGPLGLLNKQNIEKITSALNNKPTVNEAAALTRTGSPQVQATYAGLLTHMITQGKMLDGIIENSINTDLKGMLRAIVSKDVYSEAGNRVLIPRGSRLIGEYESGVEYGQTRIEVIWNRLIMPNGIDLAIGAPSTDQLGKTGITGKVDSKFGSVFSNALLISAIKIGSSAALSKLSAGNSTVSTTTNAATGSTTTIGSPAALVASDATKTATDSLTDYIGRYGEVKPTIEIAQGSKIKIFVNKDLVFSREALGG